jgi:fermentation-respiration switch protein FrsA (DUF1100 family)
MQMIILIIFIIVICLIVLASWILTNILIKPKTIPYEDLYQNEKENGRLDSEWYDTLEKKDFTLESRYGYTLSCQLLNNELSSEQFEKKKGKIKIAIICHGYTGGKYRSVVYSKLFLNRGITVLTYDHRNHGLSGKAFTSMGYYEKFDLQTVIDWCYETYGTNLAIVTHGESMGGATVLSHLAIDGRVRCVISDCSFSNLRDLVKHQLKKYYHLPAFPFIPIANLIIKLRAGFWMRDVAPIRGVMSSNAPILFIHGGMDTYIPYSMSVDMYEKKLDKKEICLIPGASHAESIVTEPKEYEKVLNAFLDNYYFDKKF